MAEFSAVPISRRRDWLAATPLILWCLFGIWGFAIQIARERHAPVQLLVMAGQVLGTAYLFQIIVLLLMRRMPRLRLASWGVRAFVLVAANSELCLLLLPKWTPSPGLALLSSVLLFIGTLGSIFALSSLGRAFAIFPQARLFSSKGPYRWSRHPLYLMETISTFGLALQFVQPWGLLVALANMALQFPRMTLEEAVMSEAFPGYAGYRQRTPRFLPFLPRLWINR